MGIGGLPMGKMSMEAAALVAAATSLMWGQKTGTESRLTQGAVLPLEPSLLGTCSMYDPSMYLFYNISIIQGFT